MNYVIFSTIQLLIFTFSLGGLYPAKQSLAHWLNQTHTERLFSFVWFATSLVPLLSFVVAIFPNEMHVSTRFAISFFFFRSFVRLFVGHNRSCCRWPKLNPAWFGLVSVSLLIPLSFAPLLSIALISIIFSVFSISCILLSSLSLQITLRSTIIMPTICGLAFIVPQFFFLLSLSLVHWAIVLFNN